MKTTVIYEQTLIIFCKKRWLKHWLCLRLPRSNKKSSTGIQLHFASNARGISNMKLKSCHISTTILILVRSPTNSFCVVRVWSISLPYLYIKSTFKCKTKEQRVLQYPVLVYFYICAGYAFERTRLTINFSLPNVEHTCLLAKSYINYN